MFTIKPFAKRPRSVAVFVAALIIVGVGFLIKAYGVLGPLTYFTGYLERSLESFNAFNIGRVFYFELTGCTVDGGGLSVTCEPAGDRTLADLRCARSGECETGVLGTVFLASVNTIGALWTGSTWLGIVLYAVALIVSGLWLASRLKPDDEPVMWLVWLLLVPAVASIAALGLSLTLSLFVFLFSQALAGLLWTLATFGGVLGWFKAGAQVFTTAHKIEELTMNSTSDKASEPKANVEKGEPDSKE